MYSTLAGFVEPGESAEETVHREIMEEAGVRVTDLRYRTSQSWPFPHSLMIGYLARYAGGELQREEEELEDLAWFHRDRLPPVPPPVTIARRLIDAWLQGEHR
jgi:NAD+ diphosphatase